MTTETEQQTLDGDVTDEGRTLPDTFVVCTETGQAILRSCRQNWPYETVSVQEWRESQSEDDSPYDEFDADGVVGAYYTITLSYSVDYRFRVPATDDRRAEEIAKEWRLDAFPADEHHVHTERREGKSIERQQLPDDWDPFGGDRICDVIDDG